MLQKAKTVAHPRSLVAMGWLALAIVPHSLPAQSPSDDKAASPVDYLKQVKPLLRERCYACHGALKQKSKLRLDTVEAMLKGSKSGPVIVKGDAAKSELLSRVSAKDVADRMPPEREGEPLTPAQIAMLQEWIASGASHPRDEQPESDPRDHWAFRPLKRPPVPQVQRGEWAKNPIDAFVAKQHEERGLSPLPEASRATLLRRLSLDLIGLPPTPEEIAAFQADQTPDWYERAVERLLADPRHGERWARHWMDIWRYSDMWGLGNELRNSQKHIWHWRDWIVESLNADLPYDQMVRLMLAGDELAPQDLKKLRATGFLARNYFLFNRHQWLDETVEHVSKGFLGLTSNCAKCHDHKFDPISQTDYYRLRAIFEPYHVRLDILPGESDLTRDGIPRVFDGVLNAPTWRLIRGQEMNPDKSKAIEPGVPAAFEFAPFKIEAVELPAEAWQPERRPWVVDAYRQAVRNKIAAAEAKVGPARDKVAKTEKQSAAQLAEARAELQLAELALAAARAELHSVNQRAAAIQTSEVSKTSEVARAAAKAEREAAAAHARVALAESELKLLRAAADKRDAATKEVAKARESFDKALKQVDEPSDQFTRFVGAQWTPTRFLSSGADDPRVTFSPKSTGRRRALAEWITDRRNPLTARVAVNHLWTRHFGTPLVSTVFDFGHNGQPPTHPELLDWLASEFIDSGWSMKHVHRLIVQSATYRLASSSADANVARDPDNIRLWRRTPSRLESQAVRDSLLFLAGTLDPTRGGPPVPQAQQADSKRRSLYFYHSNNERNLFLTMFDEALVTECYRRDQSIVPQQALALTNSQLVLDLSRPIAERISKHVVARGQRADNDEAFIRAAFLVLLAAEPTATELAASARSLNAWRKLPEAGQGDVATGFARANLVWVLLNHNDFITIR